MPSLPGVPSLAYEYWHIVSGGGIIFFSTYTAVILTILCNPFSVTYHILLQNESLTLSSVFKGKIENQMI